MKGRVLNTSVMAGLSAVAIVICVMLASVPESSAIPAFSRKYQTSCTTCHNDYPELNDFGEAFKKNGFKFPKDDDTFLKEPPVLLGAKAQKESFPNAVYPGEIPGSVPVAFRYSGNFTYNSKQPIELGFLPRTDLFVPNTYPGKNVRAAIHMFLRAVLQTCADSESIDPLSLNHTVLKGTRDS